MALDDDEETGSGMALLAAMPSDEDDSSEADDAEPDIKKAAAEDMIAALGKKDAAGLADAFERMYDACAAKYEED
jgi:hypothetical protein